MDIFAPLQQFSDWVTYSLFSIAKGSYLGNAVNFFIYDTLKILLLLITVNYLMAVIRYYLPVEKIRDFLNSRKWYGLDYLLASMFGVISPFCSCSSIPLFMGFLGAGIPLGVTFAFLITSPLVNEASIALLIGMFGLKLTLVYVGLGITVGVISGILLEKLNLYKLLTPMMQKVIDDSSKIVTIDVSALQEKKSTKELIKLWWTEGWDITKSIMLYVIVGVGVGAVIHGYVPASFIEHALSNGNWWTVPLSVVLAVPLYSNAVGVIPIMQALVEKGVPLGTAFAFMMAVVGLSFPEAMILKQAMKVKLLLIFFGIVTTGIILIGFLINFIY